jgi:hypothetical protein
MAAAGTSWSIGSAASAFGSAASWAAVAAGHLVATPRGSLASPSA